MTRAWSRAGAWLSSVACALLLALPSAAFAKAVEDVLLGADANDIMITVLADQPLNAPTVRTYAGSLRIRLYDAKDTPLLKLNGDGGAVKTVEVANGSDQTAAIVVNFTDRTRLATSDVRVERDGAKVVFRIARGLLPAMRENAPSPAAKAPAAPVPVAAPVAAPAPAAPAAPPTAQKPAPQAAKPAAPAPKQQPKQTLGTPAKKPDATDLKLAKGGESSAVPVLLSITALLALCYGAIRLVMNKRTGGIDIPAIDVIAQKRLGPRHQLVIVRAFDRDYLLSIQGGQTTVVARSSRKKLDDAEAMLSPLPFKRAPEAKLELAPPASKAPSAPANNQRSRDFEEDDEVTFGGELFKAALEQRERVRDQTANLRLEAARAEARAELARLEAEREEFSGRKSEPARNDEIIEAPKAGDAMMSEAVSGLLRLRKASGR